MKSPSISPTKNDPIPNQDINRLIAKQDPSLPLMKAKYPPVFKPLFNDAHDHKSTEDDPNYSTDNSRNKK